MNIGENIKKYRKQKGLTQVELADMCGLSRNAICKYEKNEREPNFKIVELICSSLDISITNLIESNKDNTNSIKNINEVIENIEKIILREGYNPNLVYMKGTLDGLKIALKILNNESEEN